jgi:hypothetical protein
MTVTEKFYCLAGRSNWRAKWRGLASRGVIALHGGRRERGILVFSAVMSVRARGAYAADIDAARTGVAEAMGHRMGCPARVADRNQSGFFAADSLQIAKSRNS